MLPKIREVCSFIFKSKYSDLNGIYKVLSISSLNELLDIGIDIVKDIYTPLGLEEVDYDNDYQDIKNSNFYKLEKMNVDNDEIVYVSDHFFEKIPDPNVNEYLKLVIAVDLGIFNDTDKLQWITNQIQQELNGSLGIDNNPEIFEVKSIYMTETEYTQIEEARQQNISKVSNHYTDKQELLKEINTLKTKLEYYENTLINMQP